MEDFSTSSPNAHADDGDWVGQLVGGVGRALSALLGTLAEVMVIGAVVDTTENLAVSQRRREQRARAAGGAARPYGVGPPAGRKRGGPYPAMLEGWW